MENKERELKKYLQILPKNKLITLLMQKMYETRFLQDALNDIVKGGSDIVK